MEPKNPKIYNSYPLPIVITANALNLILYLAGGYIMFSLSLIAGILYLIYLIIIEVSVYREGCIHCYYYGKLCAFGRGWIAAKIFKRGDPQKFCERELKFKDFIPQILVVLIPLVIGLVLLFSRGFNIWILIATIYPFFSWFVVNPILYGKLACVHCQQGSICCPALKFFTKGKKESQSDLK